MLTTAELQKKREELAALELARIKLNTGSMVIRVVINGDSTEFQQANMEDLLGHISALKNELAPYDVAQPASTVIVRNRSKFL